MAQINEGRRKAFVASGPLTRATRVKLVGGLLYLANANDLSIGTVEQTCFNAQDVVSINLPNLQGTIAFTANGPIAAGSLVYGATNGLVGSTVTGAPVGLALDSATASGDIIECIAINNMGLRVAYGVWTTVTASDTVVTGLNTVVAAVASFESNPVLNPGLVNAEVGDQQGTLTAAGSLLINTWEFTSSSNPTPAAATTFGKKVSYIAIGT